MIKLLTKRFNNIKLPSSCLKFEYNDQKEYSQKSERRTHYNPRYQRKSRRSRRSRSLHNKMPSAIGSNKFIWMVNHNLFQNTKQELHSQIDQKIQNLPKDLKLDLLSLLKVQHRRVLLKRKLLRKKWRSAFDQIYFRQFTLFKGLINSEPNSKEFQKYIDDFVHKRVKIPQKPIKQQKKKPQKTFLKKKKVEEQKPEKVQDKQQQIDSTKSRIQKFQKIKPILLKLKKYPKTKVLTKNQILFLLFEASENQQFQELLDFEPFFNQNTLELADIQNIIRTVYLNKRYGYLLRYIKYYDGLCNNTISGTKDHIHIQKQILYKVSRNFYLEKINRLQFFYNLMKLAPETFSEIINIKVFVEQIEKILIGYCNEQNPKIKLKQNLKTKQKSKQKDRKKSKSKSRSRSRSRSKSKLSQQQILKKKANQLTQKLKLVNSKLNINKLFSIIDYNHRLHNLMNVSLNLQNELPLAYFIAQNFFIATSFKQAIKMMTVQILLFARLYHLTALSSVEQTHIENLNDILSMLDISQQYFQQYYLNKLPNVLQHHSNKNLYKVYLDNLKIYLDNEYNQIHFRPVTFFDNCFINSSGSHNEIRYINKQTNELLGMSIEFEPQSINKFLRLPNRDFFKQKSEEVIDEKFLEQHKKNLNYLSKSQLENIEKAVNQRILQTENLLNSQQKEVIQQRKFFNTIMEQIVTIKNQRIFKDQNTNSLFQATLNNNYKTFFHYIWKALTAFDNLPFKKTLQKVQDEIAQLKIQGQNNQYLYRLKSLLPFYFEVSKPIRLSQYLTKKPNKKKKAYLIRSIIRQIKYNAYLKRMRKKEQKKKKRMKHLKQEKQEVKEEAVQQNVAETEQGKQQVQGQQGETANQELNQVPKAGFCTKKEGLESYLQTMKQIDKKILDQSLNKTIILDKSMLNQNINQIIDLQKQLLKSKDFKSSYDKFQDYLHKAPNKTQSIDFIVKNFQNIPYFSSGKQLLIGVFFNGKTETEDINQKLNLNFASNLGPIQKDYNKYVSRNPFNFKLSPYCLNILFEYIQKNYKRLQFKKFLSHLIKYENQLSYQMISSILRIINREKVGIILLQFANLIINNKINIGENSLKAIFDCLKLYKIINLDTFSIYKNALKIYKWKLDPEIFESYVGEIIRQNKQQLIDDVIKTCRELTQKKYRFNEKLTLQQNQKNEANLKELNKQDTKVLLFKLIKIFTKYNNPQNAQILFEQYRSLKQQLDGEDFNLGYLSYGTNPQKFKEILKLQEVKKQTLTKGVYTDAILSISRNPRILSDCLDDTLNLFLYKTRIIIENNQVIQISNIFRRSENTLIFSRFLQYLLRIQPPMLPETKGGFYKILNLAKDESSKNFLKGLIDLLFQKDKKQQRTQYKITKQQQQQKQKKLQVIQNEMLKQLTEKKKIEQQQQRNLLKKHGIQTNVETVEPEKPKETKKSKKQQKQQSKSKSTKSVQKTDTKKKVQTKQTPKTNQAQKKVDTQDGQKKKKFRQTKKDKKEKRELKLQNKIKSIVQSEVRQNSIITQEMRLSFTKKQIRRRGRAKFVELITTTKEMLEDQQILESKKGGRK